MADIDIDPFGEHESRPEEPTDKHIPLGPVTPGISSTWEPDRGEQETSFGGEAQRTKLMKDYRKNDLILIMTPEKQDKTLELSKHWSADSTLARNEVIMKRTYPVKSVKCDKICSNY